MIFHGQECSHFPRSRRTPRAVKINCLFRNIIHFVFLKKKKKTMLEMLSNSSIFLKSTTSSFLSPKNSQHFYVAANGIYSEFLRLD